MTRDALHHNHCRTMPPPWARPGAYRFSNQQEALMSSLHAEIKDFIAFLKPLNEKMDSARSFTIERVRGAVKKLWPEAKVKLFGSSATGLCIPGSDIDLVVKMSPSAQSSTEKLYALASCLMAENIAEPGLETISTAAVPVIKMTDSLTGCPVDICFGVEEAPNADFIERSMKNNPHIYDLVIVLKYFLRLTGLNTVYKGGLSSHALVLLVISYFQFHPMDENEVMCDEGADEGMLGVRLFNFFRLYGADFDYESTAICVADDGGYLPKHACPWACGAPLAIQDPTGGHNVTAGCYNLQGVQRAFQYGFEVLAKGATEGLLAFERTVPSLLATLIDPAAFAREVELPFAAPFHVFSSDGDSSSGAMVPESVGEDYPAASTPPPYPPTNIHSIATANAFVTDAFVTTANAPASKTPLAWVAVARAGANVA